MHTSPSVVWSGESLRRVATTPWTPLQDVTPATCMDDRNLGLQLPRCQCSPLYRRATTGAPEDARRAVGQTARSMRYCLIQIELMLIVPAMPLQRQIFSPEGATKSSRPCTFGVWASPQIV